VLAWPVIRDVFADAERRFPGVAFEAIATTPEAETAEATLRGGSAELERLVAELAKNACEGDGARGAARVAAAIDVAAEPGVVRIVVSDDGPGLAAAVLATPTAFVTTKPGGSGLGLYTAARVLGASGGSIELANAATGGAVVTLRLARR
jgi:two-component system sensor histidine kinase TctE